MSTVLWANVLVNGKVECEAEDRVALFNHTDKLDDLCKSLGLPSFAALCDSTDARFNMDEFELPDGMESTNDYMALHGAWMDLPDAVRLLEALLKHIQEKQVRFGLLKNQHADVVMELSEVLAFAEAHTGSPARFNFSIVT
ncbi:MAG: hypothetical protein ACKVS7_09010 [Gemmatimonadaceae bacterium]